MALGLEQGRKSGILLLALLLLLLELGQFTCVVHEFGDDLEQALDDLELEAGADLLQRQVDEAVEQVGEAAQADELLLPDALLRVLLDQMVEFLVHIIVVIELFVTVGQLDIHELVLHDLQAVK